MHIHALLAERMQAGLDTFVLQIGAMDGQTRDPVHPFLMRADWPALVVEPVDACCAQLQETYRHRPQVETVNVAIAEHCGATDFYRIDPAALAAGLLPGWAAGASSLYTDRTALGWEHIKPHVQRISVPCLTLGALLQQHDIAHIDVLQIDAEGHDYAILKQLDFTRHRPAIINLEIVNLPDEEQQACRALLMAQGYRYEKTGYDLVAVRDAAA